MLIRWVALKNLERVINLAIKLDPYTQKALTEFAGKTIGVKVVGLPTTIALGFTDTGITLLATPPENFDIYIEGPPLSLLKMSINEKEALSSGLISIEGDMIFAENLRKCPLHLNIDFEEHLSKLFGDIIAHQAAKTGRTVKAKATKGCETMTMNLSEYLQEESGLLVAPIAIENFINDVTDTKLATERLEARITRLENTLTKEN